MFLTLQVRTALLILVVIISIGLVFFVYRNNKNTLLSHIFALLNLSTLGWLISVYFATHPSLISDNPFMPRMALFFAVFINFFIFFLSYSVVNNNLPGKKYLTPFVFYTIFLAPLCLTSFVFKQIAGPTNLVVVPGWGMLFFSFFSVFCMLGSLYFLMKGNKKANEENRKQARIILLGIAGMSIGFVFFIMLPIIIWHSADFVQFGGFLILFFLLCTAVAIVKYQMFNISAIATEALVLVLNSFLFVQLVLSTSPKQFIGNFIVFIVALGVSYLLLKAAGGEKQRHKMEALAESNKKLLELDKQKTEFLTIAAHQLRTPVSIINNYIGMLQDGDYGQIADEAKNVLTNMDHSNQWLVRLADEFLNIANLEQGQTKFHLTKVNLANLIAKVVEEVAPKAHAAGLTINYNRSDEAIIVDADEEKIKHVLLNLLDNAVKYGKIEGSELAADTPSPSQRRGQGEVLLAAPSFQEGAQGELPSFASITITLTQENKGVAVRIKDQGIGFEKEDEQRLFQKFSRGYNAKGLHVNLSTGLGLYICKKFVEGHSGQIWARSAGAGKGSEFGFWVQKND